MARVTVSFEGETLEEALNAIPKKMQVHDGPPPEAPALTEEPKKKRRTKAQIAVDEGKALADKARTETLASELEPANDPLDLGGPADEPAVVTYEDLTNALKALIDVKGKDVTGQVMAEFGGSTKMVEIPEENYVLLRDEAVKAASA